MGVWLLIPFSAFITFSLKFILFPYKPSHKLDAPLPPGPSTIPVLGNFIWLFKLAYYGIEPILSDLHAKYGGVVSLPVPFTRPVIFIADRSLAHQALVKDAAVFSDRPPAQPAIKLVTSDQRFTATAGNGPTWRLLRRNLMCELLNPSRLKSSAGSRKWALGVLASSLVTSFEGQSDVVEVLGHFQTSMTCLILHMFFGEKVEEAKVREIVDVQSRFLMGLVGEFRMLNFGPTWFTKILFFKRWSRFTQLHNKQIDLLLPLIRTRKKVKQEGESLRKKKKEDENNNQDYVCTAFVDSLMDLELPNEGRTFDEVELTHQCSDILNSGIDTLSITLQWMMANIVKYPHIQEKLIKEMKGVLGDGAVEEVREEDLHKMKYLKAVVLEGLRRHPPGHFLLPRSVTHDVVLDGRYAIPKDCSINFMVAEMGWDPDVWEEPMEFKPERFLSDDEMNVSLCDITGSKEIKMMPFGAGRRICPGASLSILLLEYFVANLVWKFKWTAVEGVGVDLTEKVEASWVMKNPLQAHIIPRLKK